MTDSLKRVRKERFSDEFSSTAHQEDTPVIRQMKSVNEGLLWQKKFRKCLWIFGDGTVFPCCFVFCRKGGFREILFVTKCYKTVTGKNSDSWKLLRGHYFLLKTRLKMLKTHSFQHLWGRKTSNLSTGVLFLRLLGWGGGLFNILPEYEKGDRKPRGGQRNVTGESFVRRQGEGLCKMTQMFLGKGWQIA